MVNKAVEYLQSAFEADPSAMHCLMVNSVPASALLVDHPFVICDNHPPTGIHVVRALGVLNGLLHALGVPQSNAVAVRFDDDGRLVGFTAWEAQ